MIKTLKKLRNMLEKAYIVLKGALFLHEQNIGRNMTVKTRTVMDWKSNTGSKMIFLLGADLGLISRTIYGFPNPPSKNDPSM